MAILYSLDFFYPIIPILPCISGAQFSAGAVQEVTRITTCCLEGDCLEFLGFHGTNSVTADLWIKQKSIYPPQSSLKAPHGNPVGSSGADHELGHGIYVTDDIDTARQFAKGNAGLNPGTDPVLCAVYAKSANIWRSSVAKMFFPVETSIVRDSFNQDAAKACEAARNEYVNLVGLGTPYASTVRYSFIYRNRKREYSQMVLPNDIEHMFEVRVFGFNDASVVSPERPAYPNFSYTLMRRRWQIRHERAAMARVCAIHHKLRILLDN